MVNNMQNLISREIKKQAAEVRSLFLLNKLAMIKGVHGGGGGGGEERKQ